ncbi:MAG: DUF6973 domain-containing protein [Bacteroidia bacterium]
MQKKIYVCTLMGVFFATLSFAQQNYQSFRQLSKPEKYWVLSHPFVAKKAWRCTQRARAATDSLAQAEVLTDANGGQLDAFRHAYWMVLLRVEIGERRARKLGEAHERGNYIEFKNGKQEDGALPDSVSTVMDERNNAAGRALGDSLLKNTADSSFNAVQLVLFAVWNGELWIIRKDENGRPLNCTGDLILEEEKKKWNIPKCLVRSDEIVSAH